MGITKSLKFSNVFVFLFFVLFPFGQIIKIGLINPLDLVAMGGALFVLISNQEKPLIFKYFQNFLFIVGLGWIFSLFTFDNVWVLYGLLYFARLFVYTYFFVYVWNFCNTNKKNKDLVVSALLAVSVVSAFFGWVQFFTFPDIKPFFTWGWDEHLFRIVGTFLDPTFLGLIIVFGLLASLEKRKYLLAILLLLSLAFTYSRASYLAFLAGSVYLAYVKQRLSFIVYPVVILVGLIFVLPTSKNHSIEFMRSFSAIARIENYKTAVTVFEKAPVFGVGYNNMCLAYRTYIGPQSFSSHACSGSDSSLLLVLATTGLTGFFGFVYNILMVRSSLSAGKYSGLLGASFVAILVHSLFSNSFFYPWIYGYMLMLLAVVYDTK